MPFANQSARSWSTAPSGLSSDFHRYGGTALAKTSLLIFAVP